MFASSVTIYSSPLLHSPNLPFKLQQNQNLVGVSYAYQIVRFYSYSDIDSRVIVVAP